MVENELLKQAENYFNNNDFRNARIILHRVLQDDLCNYKARFLLARSAENLFLREEALFCYSKLIEVKYGEISSHWVACYNIYNDMCEFSIAIQCLNNAEKNGLTKDKYDEYLYEIFHKSIRYIHEYNFNNDFKKVNEITTNILSVFPKEYYKMYNAYLSEQELAMQKIILKSKPRVATVVLTTKCNVRCLMCNLDKQKQYELPEKTKIELLKLMPYLERIVLLGGEVFLYPYFDDIIDVAMKYKTHIDIITNGSLFTKNMIEKLVQCNGDIAISLDGTSKDVHEHIRRGINFDTVINNINLINQTRQKYNSKITLKLYVTIMRSNYHQIESFVDFAHKYKFDFIFINSVNCRNEEDIFYTYFDPKIIEFISKEKEVIAKKTKEYGITLMDTLPTKQMYVEWLRPVIERHLGNKDLDIPEEYLEILNNNRIKANTNAENKEEKNNSPRKNNNINCYVPWRKLYFDFDGTVRPDCYCWNTNGNIIVGDVKKDTIESIWNSKEMQDCRAKILNGSNDSICNNECLCGKVPEQNLRKIY